MKIETSFEQKHGCGYRKEGGLYMVSGDNFAPCGLLPLELTVCPYCNQGIKHSRGFSWISLELFRGRTCKDPLGRCKKRKQLCLPFNDLSQKVGLIWIGKKFYKTPAEFNNETIRQGISRRIPNIPKDFVIGETWVLLAHIEGMEEYEVETGNIIKKPAIFTAFRPTAIEYIVKTNKDGSIDDDTEKLERLEKRGVKLVKVRKKEEKQTQLSIDS